MTKKNLLVSLSTIAADLENPGKLTNKMLRDYKNVLNFALTSKRLPGYREESAAELLQKIIRLELTRKAINKQLANAG